MLCAGAMLLLAVMLCAVDSPMPEPAASAPPEASAPLDRDADEPSTDTRFGVVALTGLVVRARMPAGIAGLGLRFGLRDRRTAPTMFMPAVAIVGGVEVWKDWINGWAEARFELMAAGRGGPLQPSYGGFGSVGVSIGPRWTRAPLSPPDAFVRPYLGLGTGWNVSFDSLKNASLGGGGAGILVLLALPVILAGRVELRVTPELAGYPAEVAGVIGFGF